MTKLSLALASLSLSCATLSPPSFQVIGPKVALAVGQDLLYSIQLPDLPPGWDVEVFALAYSINELNQVTSSEPFYELRSRRAADHSFLWSVRCYRGKWVIGAILYDEGGRAVTSVTHETLVL